MKTVSLLASAKRSDDESNGMKIENSIQWVPRRARRDRSKDPRGKQERKSRGI